MVCIAQAYGSQPRLTVVFKQNASKEQGNTYIVGCTVSLIFLYASKDADPTVCIIKETNKESCRLLREGSCLGWVLE